MLFRSEWSGAAAQFAVPANNSGGQMAFMRIAPPIVVITSSLRGVFYCTSATIANDNYGTQPFSFERGNIGIDKSIYYYFSTLWLLELLNRTPLPIKLLAIFPKFFFFIFLPIFTWDLLLCLMKKKIHRGLHFRFQFFRLTFLCICLCFPTTRTRSSAR